MLWFAAIWLLSGAFNCRCMKRTLPLTGVEIAFCSAGGLPLLHLLILLRILSFLPNRASVRIS